MSKGVNKVTLIGYLGTDPEIRYIPNGPAVANLSVATTDTWRDKNTGEQKEHTEWHRVVLKGRLAEVAGEYLKKGSQVYLEGRNRTRKWTDSQQIDRYVTEVLCNEMQMLGGGRGGEPQAPQKRTAQPGHSTSSSTALGAGPQLSPHGGNFGPIPDGYEDDLDIPF